jgi:hypothetical protein
MILFVTATHPNKDQQLIGRRSNLKSFQRRLGQQLSIYVREKKIESGEIMMPEGADTVQDPVKQFSNPFILTITELHQD